MFLLHFDRKRVFVTETNILLLTIWQLLVWFYDDKNFNTKNKISLISLSWCQRFRTFCHKFCCRNLGTFTESLEKFKLQSRKVLILSKPAAWWYGPPLRGACISGEEDVVEPRWGQAVTVPQHSSSTTATNLHTWCCEMKTLKVPSVRC